MHRHSDSVPAKVFFPTKNTTTKTKCFDRFQRESCWLYLEHLAIGLLKMFQVILEVLAHIWHPYPGSPHYDIYLNKSNVPRHHMAIKRKLKVRCYVADGVSVRAWKRISVFVCAHVWLSWSFRRSPSEINQTETINHWRPGKVLMIMISIVWFSNTISYRLYRIVACIWPCIQDRVNLLGPMTRSFSPKYPPDWCFNEIWHLMLLLDLYLCGFAIKFCAE